MTAGFELENGPVLDAVLLLGRNLRRKALGDLLIRKGAANEPRHFNVAPKPDCKRKIRLRPFAKTYSACRQKIFHVVLHAAGIPTSEYQEGHPALSEAKRNCHRALTGAAPSASSASTVSRRFI